MNCIYCPEKIGDDGYGVLVHLITTPDNTVVTGSYFCHPQNYKKSTQATAKK